jgi:alanyl-tRNA synthetase
LTERLYYHDSSLTNFQAEVVSVSADGLDVELSRTAFYPTSGGQPHDLGQLAGIEVADVFESDSRLIHRIEKPLPNGTVLIEGRVDAERRLDHMRQHTGQHLLSAVMEEQFGLKTISFHMGADYATVDVEPNTLAPDALVRIEELANQRLLENLSVTIAFEDSRTVKGLRKPPDREGMLRVVSIDGLDRSACGGTHVSRTAEIGCIVLGKTEKVRNALRIEFYCAGRALRFLKQRVQQSESQTAALRDRLAEADKRAKRLSAELAEISGRRKYTETTPDNLGRRIWREHFEDLNDDAKSMMNAFLAEPGTIAVFTGTIGARISFSAHPGLGLDCGSMLKSVLAQLGGKGGGSPRSAQGSLADPANLDQAVNLLLS